MIHRIRDRSKQRLLGGVSARTLLVAVSLSALADAQQTPEAPATAASPAARGAAAPSPAPTAPAPSTTDDASAITPAPVRSVAAVPSVAPEEPENPLLPPGEAERMSGHPIAVDKLSFKPGRGLSAVSEDGDFQLNLGVRSQFLYSLLHDNADEGETEHGFQIRRARVVFTGNMFDPRVKYKLEIALSPRDTNTADSVVTTSPLLDFYTDLVLLRDLSLRVGQYKVPFNRQRVISSGALQFVDRAITNAEFNLDRDIGIDLRSEDFLGLDALRYYLGIYPGGGRNSFENEEPFHMFLLGRVEVLPFGDFEDYVEADFERTGPRLSVGISGAHIDDSPTDRGILGSAPSDGGTTDFTLLEADFSFKLYGFSAMGEVFYRDGERTAGSTLDDDGNLTISPARNGTGLHLQAGYLIPRIPLELALRYATVNGSDDAGEDGLADLQEYAAGVSYYFAHHQLKLQVDYTRLVPDGEFGDGRDQIRSQLQIAY